MVDRGEGKNYKMQKQELKFNSLGPFSKRTIVPGYSHSFKQSNHYYITPGHNYWINSLKRHLLYCGHYTVPYLARLANI